MSYTIGIDTGGTYTDAVLMDMAERKLTFTAKAPTTKEDLTIGIRGSLKGLSRQQKKSVTKVVLSTTLATNAVVEGNFHKAGLIAIGRLPEDEVPTAYKAAIQGALNVKGRELAPVNENEIRAAADFLLPQVEALAVSGLMSVRNPAQELYVKNVLKSLTNMPIVCGHELAAGLGFQERTTTAVLNAGLLPIITGFIEAVETALAQENIMAPIFMVRGDGTMADLDMIRSKPVDTLLSGPAASMIGAMYLTGLDNAVVADMGGTTTDVAMLESGIIRLAAKGAVIGPWRTMVKSAEISTCGLGGDSEIKLDEDQRIIIGPNRVLPASRGGNKPTPTDILHCTGAFTDWNKLKALTAVEDQAAVCGWPVHDYMEKVQASLVSKLMKECLPEQVHMPVVAIGAPAKTWFGLAAAEKGFKLIIPEHYEVANAVGAAVSELKETVTALVRPGEERRGYLVHTSKARHAFSGKEAAVQKALKETRGEAENLVRKQGARNVEITVSSRDIFSEPVSRDGLNEKSIPSQYIETRISATALGRFF